MSKLKQAGLAILALLMAAYFTGCASFGDYGVRDQRKSSVVEYLYPREHEPRPPTGMTVLPLPLKVGVAFVPAGTECETMRLGEDQQVALLERVSTRFRSYDFVDTIQVIPSAYLRPQGGFDNVEQMATMFGLDVIALVSYDQTRFTREGLASLAYWTLVGAYVVQGEINDTHTMVDTAVYDIKSRTLLFRAPGVSQVKGRSTLVGLARETREDSEEGFQLACDDLEYQLGIGLHTFRERLKQKPKNIQVTRRAGYTGAGSVDTWVLLAVLLLAGAQLWKWKRT
jgi:rhombotail lipoprotein